MILYKYTSLKTAQKIIDSAKIGFSRPGFFNDPFDKPVATPEKSAGYLNDIFANIRGQGKSYIWDEYTGILSLTRSSTNALMWAHYADGHRGVVLEIDTDVAGLTCVKRNMIPTQYGSVIYSRSRPTGQYSSDFKEGVAVGATHHFDFSHFEKWQRLFLTKPLDWAYEEELRVAKCLKGLESKGTSSNPSGNCTIVDIEERPLHCFEFPINAISRIIVGARADKNKGAELVEEHPEIELCHAVLDEDRFEVHINS